MPSRAVPVPAVPTPLTTVELVDSRSAPVIRRAAVVAKGDSDTPWLGPEADVLLAGGSAAEPSGAAGDVLAVADGGEPGWLVGVGTRRPIEWRTAGMNLVRAVSAAVESASAKGARASRVSVDLSLPGDLRVEELDALTLGARLGGYRFQARSTENRPKTPIIRLRVAAVTDELQAAVRRASILAGATALTRDLANMPSNVKDPKWLAGVAARLAGDTSGLTATVRDERWLADEGFGGMLAVGGGSACPPRLIELAWRPRGAAAGHLVLVGKGITFDTGGISLKPAENMHLMRTDMAGGAAVIAALRAIAELAIPVRVTGLVPAAENHVSGSAYRPGDVVRHYDGSTTEVSNTDAEGRMVLADALGYAVRRCAPSLLVDVATLTGAMKVSLGLRTGGLFASDDEVAKRISTAGDSVGEAWWRMPLLADHVPSVRGELADLRQCPPGPGGITAALFLREFTGGLPWAHMDIAGPARAEKPYVDVVAGATGFAARTLVAVAESLAAH